MIVLFDYAAHVNDLPPTLPITVVVLLVVWCLAIFIGGSLQGNPGMMQGLLSARPWQQALALGSMLIFGASIVMFPVTIGIINLMITTFELHAFQALVLYGVVGISITAGLHNFSQGFARH